MIYNSYYLEPMCTACRHDDLPTGRYKDEENPFLHLMETPKFEEARYCPKCLTHSVGHPSTFFVINKYDVEICPDCQCPVEEETLTNGRCKHTIY